MARHPFSTSPNYLQHIRGLHRLHALTLINQDDSPEADEVRDGLDLTWYNLSETEQARIKGLSEDLYSISDPPQEPLPPNPQVLRKLTEASEARVSEKWDLALSILRRWSRHIDTALLSYLRGGLWQEAGDDATATLFFEHATRLNPTHDPYRVRYLLSVNNFDHDKAFELSKEILDNDASQPPSIVVMASGIALESVRKNGVTFSISPSFLIPKLENALARLQNEDPENMISSDPIYLANILLSQCYDLAGNLRAAIRSLDQALAVDPNDWNLLLYRGLLRYGVDAGAIDDFRKATQLGSTVVWPNFYLAHYFLLNNQFEDCLRMCEQGLNYSSINVVQATFYEWQAIARSELRFPPEQVRSAFEEAIRLAPDADRIRQNFETFENALLNPRDPKRDWMKPNASTVKSIGRFVPPLPPLPLAA
jgi:tetratricopeptide (TPR) repeat protein